MNKKKKLLPTKISRVKLVPWNRIAPKRVFPVKKGSRAGVIVDNKGVPLLFLFDTAAFLDILSEIDEKLVDKLSTQDYHSKDSNPAGWLIDTIESKLPLKPEYIQSLKQAISEAKKKGWIPFEEIEQKFGLA